MRYIQWSLQLHTPANRVEVTKCIWWQNTTFFAHKTQNELNTLDYPMRKQIESRKILFGSFKAISTDLTNHQQHTQDYCCEKYTEIPPLLQNIILEHNPDKLTNLTKDTPSIFQKCSKVFK